MFFSGSLSCPTGSLSVFALDFSAGNFTSDEFVSQKNKVRFIFQIFIVLHYFTCCLFTIKARKHETRRPRARDQFSPRKFFCVTQDGLNKETGCS